MMVHFLNKCYQALINNFLVEQAVPEGLAVLVSLCIYLIHMISNAPRSRVCNGFAQLGARGSSVIFSSGDK